MSFRKPTEEEKHKFMGRAIALSDEGPSKGHGGPFGAVIVKDGQIIGKLDIFRQIVSQPVVVCDLRSRERQSI